MGDERDPNEQTMEERVAQRRDLDEASEGSPKPTPRALETKRDLPAFKPADTDPQQLRIVDRSTISESAITEAKGFEGGLARLAPLMGKKNEGQKGKSADGNPVVSGPSGNMTQETAPPLSALSHQLSLRQQAQAEAEEPAPTQRLPQMDIDQIPKGNSIPSGVLQRIMQGLDSQDPSTTTRSSPPVEQPFEDDVSASWDEGADEAETEPMDQKAFAAFTALNAPPESAQLGDEGGPTPASGQEIVSLADLVHERADAKDTPPDFASADDLQDGASKTQQNRLPRARFVAEEVGPQEESKRRERQTSIPPRPAVVRAPKGSMPVRPVTPSIVRPESSPPQAVRPDLAPPRVEPAPVADAGRSSIPIESVARKRSVYHRGAGEIPSVDNEIADGRERVTVVKPKANRVPKRLIVSPTANTEESPIEPSDAVESTSVEITGEASSELDLKSGSSSLDSQDISSIDTDSVLEGSHESSGRFHSVLAAVIDEASLVGVLRVVGGQADGQIFPLVKAENSVGRGAENDVVLLDLGVSRRHVTICRHQEGFRIVDAGSGNGSYVNGAIVSEAELYDGDTIRLGGTELEYRTQGAPRVRGPEPSLAPSPSPNRYASLALVAFTAAFGTMLVLGWFTPTPMERLAEMGAMEWVERTKERVAERRWEDARQALAVSRNFGESDEHAELGARIERERESARVFAQIEADIARQAPIETIEERLRALPAESVYRGLAGAKVRAAKKNTLERLLDSAQRDLDKGRNEAARIKIEGVLKHDVAYPRAKKMLTDLK